MKGICLIVASIVLTSGKSPFGAWELASSIVGLLLFAVLLVAAYFGLRWYSGKMGLKTGKNIKVLEKTFLAKDSFLFVVQVGGKTMLLGATPQSIQTLCELDESTLVYEDAVQQADFGEMLKSFMKKGQSEKNED
jgi:flagellar biogenesis protein FliO